MHIYIYIYIYITIIHTYMYVYIHTHIHIHIHIHTHTHIYIYTYMYVIMHLITSHHIDCITCRTSSYHLGSYHAVPRFGAALLTVWGGNLEGIQGAPTNQPLRQDDASSFQRFHLEKSTIYDVELDSTSQIR